jgi:signal recognition particle GTPase
LKAEGMTIQIISEQIKVIQTKWKNIVSTRPGEDAAVKNFFGQAANYSVMSSQIDRWQEQITRLSAKPRVSQSLPKGLVISTVRCLSSVSRSLDSVGNGVEWIFLSGGFGQSFLLADYLINELVKDTSREQVQILDEAKNRLSSDLKSLQDGAENAKNLNDSWPKIEEQLEQLEASSESFTEILDKLSKIVDDAKLSVEQRADEATDSITEESKKVIEAKAKFDETLASTTEGFIDAEKIKSSAENLLADITQKSLSAAVIPPQMNNS